MKMPKALKIGLATLGGVLAVLLAALVVFIVSFDPNTYKPQLAQTVQQQYRRTLTIPGPISLSLFPRLGVKVGEVTLSERDSSAPFASIASAQVSLALWPLLQRQVVMDRLEVHGLRAHIVQFKDGSFSIDDLLGGGGGPAGAAAARPAGAKGDARAGATADAQSAVKPATATAIALDIARIALIDAGITYEDRKAPRRLQLSKLMLETGRLAPGVVSPVLLKARLDVDAPKLGSDLAFKAQLKFTPLADKAIGLIALESLEFDIDGKLDATPLKARLTGAVQADLAAGKLNAKLAGQFDESKFSATLAMPRFAPAAYTFDAEVDRLNLDRYRPAGGAATPAVPAAPPAPEKPLDLSALRDLDASGQLRIGSLQVMNLKVSQLRAGVKAAGGRLVLAPLAAELYQGKLAGSATVTPGAAAGAPSRIGLQQKLEGIAIGPLLKDLTGNDALQGRGQLALDVTTAGATVGAMSKALAGQARVDLKDGAFRGINIAQALRRAKAVTAAVKGKEAKPAAGGAAEGAGSGTAARGDSTDFSELSASFQLTGGVARNDDLAAKSPLLRLGGRGDIDLGASRLDYTVRATIVSTLEGQGGPELQALRGQTLPVRLTGPFHAIEWRIDVAGMAKEAAKAKLEEKGEALKDDAKRRLGDKLRGLIKK